LSKPALKLENEYRSKLERKFADQLTKAGVRFEYEALKIEFRIPERVASYTPDFDIDKSCIVVETKGYFRKASDRQRLVLIKEQHPQLDIRLVFQDASKPIYKGSPTTYGEWADFHGFQWADKGTAPEQWIKEIKELQNGHGNAINRYRPEAKASGKNRTASSRKGKKPVVR
jgi:Phage endonuclease I